MKSTKKATRKNHYTFKAKIQTKTGRSVETRYEAPAVNGKLPFTVPVEYADAKEAYNSDGQGDCAACAVNVAVVNHPDCVPYAFDSSWVDVLYHRLILGVTGKNGTPHKAIILAHYSSIPREFDKKAGLRRLMEKLKENGPIHITFYPILEGKHSVTGKPTNPRGSGLRKPGRSGLHGYELRKQVRLLERGI